MDVEKLIEKHKSRIEDVFRYNDRDYDDLVEKKHLATLMRSVGLAPSNAELHEFESKFPEDTISLNDFIDIIREFVNAHKDDPPLRDRLKESFNSMLRENEEKVPAKELKHVLRSVGERLNEEEVNRLFAKHNVHEDEELDFERFCTIFAMENDLFGLYNK